MPSVNGIWESALRFAKSGYPLTYSLYAAIKDTYVLFYEGRKMWRNGTRITVTVISAGIGLVLPKLSEDWAEGTATLAQGLSGESSCPASQSSISILSGVLCATFTAAATKQAFRLYHKHFNPAAKGFSNPENAGLKATIVQVLAAPGNHYGLKTQKVTYLHAYYVRKKKELKEEGGGDEATATTTTLITTVIVKKALKAFRQGVPEPMLMLEEQSRHEDFMHMIMGADRQNFSEYDPSTSNAETKPKSIYRRALREMNQARRNILKKYALNSPPSTPDNPTGVSKPSLRAATPPSDYKTEEDKKGQLPLQIPVPALAGRGSPLSSVGESPVFHAEEDHSDGEAKIFHPGSQTFFDQFDRVMEARKKREEEARKKVREAKEKAELAKNTPSLLNRVLGRHPLGATPTVNTPSLTTNNKAKPLPQPVADPHALLDNSPARDAGRGEALLELSQQSAASAPARYRRIGLSGLATE